MATAASTLRKDTEKDEEGEQMEDRGNPPRSIPPPLVQHPSPSRDLTDRLTDLKGSCDGWVSPMTATPIWLGACLPWCFVGHWAIRATTWLAGWGLGLGCG